ncbi:MAG: GNAT family protein [Bacteroidales bacterium]|jgi:diamine N-acetyltransferase|nr:GNAT family N-acetyltransferase [Bacteroidales bacterium]MDI9592598.1 GNAT family protein [Bacteroidota bacterium]NLH32349.1 GNAT family N-acetyltransferase [Lentimicrobium sp.]OQC36935.1 MAG: Spermidine N(1)-acetyltransferase [Bacteroidetes bacterium ADurb.Bin041]MBP7874855.1 GNAT family N-acetyltransferase [Bacteroidales bacterium]
MIKGKEILLRAPEMSDVDMLYNLENDLSIWRLSNTNAPLSRFAIEQYILNAGLEIFETRQVRFMIVNLSDEKAIGTIDLFDYEPIHRRAGIGIYLEANERGKGKASEALDLVIDYCFNTLMLRQVYCNISPDNVQSKILFEKKGFTLIGTKRSWLLIQNQWMDEDMYQLINL